MSTTLQTMWSNSGNYVMYSPNSLVEKVNKTLINTVPDVELTIEQLCRLSTSIPDNESGKINVLSGESLSFSYLGQAQLGDYILLKQKYLAQTLGGQSNKVLIMVRNPIQWIYSAHAQHIKEGGATSFGDYVQGFRSVILNNLNLRALKSYWSEADCEVIVIPIELYKKNIDQFWQVYEKELGVSAPDRRNDQLGVIESNTTSYDTLDIHQTLNSTIGFLENIINRSDFIDKGSCLQSLQTTRQWATRRALSFSDDKENMELRTVFGLPEFQSQSELCVDTAFIDYLQNNFLEVLPNKDYFIHTGILESYKMSLDDSLSHSCIDAFEEISKVA